MPPPVLPPGFEPPKSRGPLRITAPGSSAQLKFQTTTSVPVPAPPAAATSTSSSLSIYAKKYVPEWLRLVNTSAARNVFCLPLNKTNFAAFIASFAGNGILAPQPHYALPEHRFPAHSGRIDITEHTLGKDNYIPYFFERLQYETGSVTRELGNYAMYNIPFAVENQGQSLQRIHIPGLRENAPQVDLGDKVLVRPVVPIDEQAARLVIKQWKTTGRLSGHIAPGFSGVEYSAVVWGISKAKELLILRVDGMTGNYNTCNVIFTSQDHKSRFLYHSVATVASQLNSKQSWPRSMLFPDNRDAIMQTALSTGTFNLNFTDKLLNYEQQKAISTIVDNEYGEVPYLISGPPGTGKTKTIVETAIQLISRESESSIPHILVCAPSDAAADTLTSRLSLHFNKFQLFRLNGYTRSFAEVPEHLMLYCYYENDLFTLPPFPQLMSFRIIVTTCRDANMLVQARLTNLDLSQLLRSTLSNITGKTKPVPLHWSALLLDEAAQATEPESDIPFSVIMPPDDTPGAELPQFILAGDQHQLGPRLASATLDTGLATSLFARLAARPFYNDHPLSRRFGSVAITKSMLPIPRPAFTNLIRNYRSHPAILSEPSRMFYADTLIPENTAFSASISSWPSWTSPHNFPIRFIQNSSPDDVDDVIIGDGTGSGSLYNAGEATIALDYVSSLLSHVASVTTPTSPKEEMLRAEDVVVMSPFRAQVNYLRKVFRAKGLAGVNIGPLEAFQGLEGRVVVLCTTRTRVGPEGEERKWVEGDVGKGLGVVGRGMERRFNVAMTRAKEGVVVVGNAVVLRGDDRWRQWLGFVVRNGCVEEGEIDVQGLDLGDEKVGRLESGLKYVEEEGRVLGPAVIGDDGIEMPGDEGEDGESEASESEAQEEGHTDVYGTLKALQLDGAVM